MAMTIAEIADLYLTDKRRTRRESTVEGYESALRLHVLPRWGSMAVEEIEPDAIQDWVALFDLPGASEKAYKTLRQVIRWAIRRLGLRVYDPTTAGIELPRKPAYRPQVLDAAQARDYLRGLWGCEAEAAAICSLTLGLRRGESCALTWGDVNLRTGEVRISKSRQDVRSGTVVVPPKTDRSDRSLWLPAFALRRLRQLAKGRRKSDLICPLSPTATARTQAAPPWQAAGQRLPPGAGKAEPPGCCRNHPKRPRPWPAANARQQQRNRRFLTLCEDYANISVKQP